MTDYVPGALGALFSGGTSLQQTNTSKKTVIKRQTKNEVPEVTVKKAKLAVEGLQQKPITTKTKPKTSKKKAISKNYDDTDSSVPTSTGVSNVMVIKKRPPLEDSLKQQRESAKQKKKDIAQAKLESQDREVFVGNLTSEVRRRDVEKIFKKYGSIEKVWSRSIIGMNEKKSFAVQRKFKNAGNNALSHANFYIRFKTADEAVKALEMNGTLFRDHHLRVSLANKSKLQTTHSAFVSNLPFDVTDEEVYSHFDDAGEIKAVRVVHDKYSGLGKGIAYVEFGDKEGVEAAVKLNDTLLKGRKIRVSKSLKKAQVIKEAAAKAKVKKEKAKSAKHFAKKPITEEEKVAKKISKFTVQKSGNSKSTTSAASKSSSVTAKKKKTINKKAKKTPKSILAA